MLLRPLRSHRFTQLASAAALCAAALLSACSGGGDDDEKVSYSKLISFGDSLSDVGTYKVSGVAAAGGGKYTINGTTGLIWVDLLSAELLLGVPCAAQTGLEANEALIGFPPVAVSNHSECSNYAQGGARVTDPVGPGNKALLAMGNSDGALGQLTVPVKTQIANHLAAHGGKFDSDELVTVLAGGNDVFMAMATLEATITGGGDPTAAATAAVTALGTAGAELAGYINSQIIGNGATRVVVANLPDVSLTPYAMGESADTRALIKQMVDTFNAQLSSGLASAGSKVLVFDSAATLRDQVANPLMYGLSNVDDPACLAETGSSLFCTGDTLVSATAGTYLFADGVHPTPLGHAGFYNKLRSKMKEKGWL